MNYPPTPEAMGWASEVIDSPNGNALLRFCFISESVPEPDSIFKSTRQIWLLHSTSLRKEYWYKDMFWSDGYFVCSIGEASPDTIREYILNQG